MSDVWVKSFTHLKDRPHADRALPMLQRVASLVKPIMRKHHWVLPVLAEFFPDTPNLIGLNVNGGQQILLRLRPAWAPDTFYEIEEVVHTMLHELTHNVHGPHDTAFYNFLSGLEDEYATLKRNGYAGEGFFTPGQRLGAGHSRDLPPHFARLKALEAAEKRRRVGSMLGSGGRLGGDAPIGRAWTHRELAAQAAERRARDEKFCGSHSGVDVQREAARAAQDGIQVVIDRTDDNEARALAARPVSNVARDPRQQTASTLGAGSRTPAVSHPAPHRPPVTNSRPTGSKDWSCGTCTLLNPPMVLQCQACLSNRPVDPALGWSCMTCGEAGMPHEFWNCTFCGEAKRVSPVA